MSWVLLSEPWGFLALLLGVIAIFGGAIFCSWLIGEVLVPYQARKRFLKRYQARKRWEKAQAVQFDWPSPYNR